MSEKMLKVKGTATHRDDGIFEVKGDVLGLDEYLAAMFSEHLKSIGAEMDKRCDNTRELLSKFEKRISEMEHKTKGYSDFLNHLNQKISELETLKEDVAKMIKLKPSIPLRFADYANLHKQKLEENR